MRTDCLSIVVYRSPTRHLYLVVDNSPGYTSWLWSPQNHVFDSIQRNTQQGRASFFLFRKTINVYIIYTIVLAGS